MSTEAIVGSDATMGAIPGDGREWLELYGYVGAGAKDADLDRAVDLVRKEYGLKPGGGWDEKLKRAIASTRRCGVTAAAFNVNYIPRWGKLDLNYFIGEYVDELTRNDVDALIAEAFHRWERVCGLRFTQVSDPALTDLRFGVGRGRRAGFDGPSGTLAYAFSPGSSNYLGPALDLRFDLDETWVKDPRDPGILLLQVAGHEIGHLIGHNHFMQPRQWMNALYNPAIDTPQSYEAAASVQLYGPSRAVIIPTTPVPTPTTPVSPSGVDVQVKIGNAVYQALGLTKIK